MGKLFTPENTASGFNTVANLASNFSNIENAFDKCLARTGEAPNQMEADLDMNSKDILNVNSITIQGKSLDQYILDVVNGEQ